MIFSGFLLFCLFEKLFFEAFLRIHEIEEKIRRRAEFIVHEAFAVDFAHASDDFLDVRAGPQDIARNDGMAEADFIHAGEHRDEPAVFFGVLQRDASDLGHGFTDERAGHDGFVGEMALEEGLVRRDALDADGVFQRVEFEDAVDEEHRIAVRQNFFDFIDVKLKHEGLLMRVKRFAALLRAAAKGQKPKALYVAASPPFYSPADGFEQKAYPDLFIRAKRI